MNETVLPAAGRWHERWLETCHWLSLPRSVWSVGEKLRDRYGDSSRHYHEHSHVLALLESLDSFPGVVRDHDALEMAIWFHDAIYDPRAPSGENERRSADLFHRELGDLLRSTLDASTVESLILETCHLAAPPISSDGALIRDIDLAILAAESPRYLEYCMGIRREYSHFEDAEYFRGRASFIKGMLSRKRIYHTHHFRKLWEVKARENMVAELDEIMGTGD